MSEDTENLFPPDGPKWAVITCHKRQSKLEIAEKRPKERSSADAARWRLNSN